MTSLTMPTGRKGNLTKEEIEDGIYGKCSVCGNIVYEHMKNNKELIDSHEMCGACVHGEADAYIEEL